MRYRTIVADPPWPMKWSGGASTRVNGRGERHTNHRASVKSLPYATMSIDAISTLPVASIAEDDAHLYLWVPDRFLIQGDGLRVAEAWGFTALRLLIWRKTGFGLGTFPRPQHEALIVCRRGRLPFAVRNVGSVQTWKLPYSGGKGNARVHSRKPPASIELVETASPGPYLELFSRATEPREGWSYWGDESLGTAELPEQAA